MVAFSARVIPRFSWHVPHWIWNVPERPLTVVALCPDQPGQVATRVLTAFQVPEDALKVELRAPSKVASGALVRIHTVYVRGCAPSQSGVDGLEPRHSPSHDRCSVGAQVGQVRPRERRRRTDDEPVEAKLGRALERENMGGDDIRNVDSAIQELVRLQIGICVRAACDLVVVRLGEEAGRAKYKARQALVPAEQLAEIFCRRLGDA